MKEVILNSPMIGQTINPLRTANGLSKKKLAKLLNVSVHSIYLWERGSAHPNLKNVITICNLFCISMAHLLRYSVVQK